MTLYATLSRQAAEPGRGLGQPVVEGIIVTDGDQYRVLGRSGTARGLARRAPRWFERGDQHSALLALSRTIGTMTSISDPVEEQGSLDEVTARLSRQHGLPVVRLAPARPRPAPRPRRRLRPTG